MDGWPQFSDAVVDYYFNKKLAYEFIRRSQQDLCVMLREPEGDTQQIVAVNDFRDEKPITFSVWDLEADREVCAGEGSVPANATALLDEIPFDAGKQTLYRIAWSSKDSKGLNHYLAGYPPFDLSRYSGWLARISETSSQAIFR